MTLRHSEALDQSADPVAVVSAASIALAGAALVVAVWPQHAWLYLRIAAHYVLSTR